MHFLFFSLFYFQNLCILRAVNYVYCKACDVFGSPRTATRRHCRNCYSCEFRTVPKIPRFGDFEGQSLEFPSHKLHFFE
nr:MAG TPA: palmitoyltransferase [Bacteriophage sp.]